MKLGIMQGRLSAPVNGRMQEFPEDWEREFVILKDLGLNHIEWLITKNSWLSNPIMKNIKHVEKFPISFICLDTLVDKRISNLDFLSEKLGMLCEKVSDTSMKNLTIPLLEESNMEDDKKREKFCRLIKKYGMRFPTINFSFEAELQKEKLLEIVSLCDNFFVTYDTGNMTSYGVDHLEYIDFFKHKINNIHLKDRTVDAATVNPLTGDTDFDLIFNSLEKIGYNGVMTMQTARSMTGEEIETTTKHRDIFMGLYERSF
jgi:L-ribulose-5-phosphate 3-epimerase